MAKRRARDMKIDSRWVAREWESGFLRTGYAIQGVTVKLRRGDGRVGLDLLREMKTTEQLREKSAGRGTGLSAAEIAPRERRTPIAESAREKETANPEAE